MLAQNYVILLTCSEEMFEDEQEGDVCVCEDQQDLS